MRERQYAYHAGKAPAKLQVAEKKGLLRRPKLCRPTAVTPELGQERSIVLNEIQERAAPVGSCRF